MQVLIPTSQKQWGRRSKSRFAIYSCWKIVFDFMIFTYFYLIIMLFSLDLNELYETCHVKFPKNYYIVRFKSRLLGHAEGGLVFSF